MNAAVSVTTDAQIAELRQRIGWICHGLRLAVVSYPLWVLWLLVTHWADLGRLEDSYGRAFKADLSGMAGWQQATGFSVDLTSWVLLVLACSAAWRLFSGYLEGDIFSAASARVMRRVALLGIAAQLWSMTMRPVLAGILTAHLPGRSLHVVLLPHDMLILLLLASLLALAHIQKTGADIAGDHAQIV